MKKRWVNGFTIVELLLVILVIGIIASITVLGYNGVRKSAIEKAAQSDLQNASAAMARTLQKTNSYPSVIPSEVKTSQGITLELNTSGTTKYYTNLTKVQNGVLFAQICADLISEGIGQGVNQGGVTEKYITECGDWNYDSMQVTGWETKLWNVPVDEAQLLSYANSFTSNDNWNKAAHEAAVKSFYNEITNRFKQQGGKFPIISFWDYWASEESGGVKFENLPPPIMAPYFCIEARSATYNDIIWHVTQEDKITQGNC